VTFTVENLRIRTTVGRDVVNLTLVDALDAQRQLARAVDELTAALDVTVPPSRDPGER